jgi:hypothetical protein
MLQRQDVRQFPFYRRFRRKVPKTAGQECRPKGSSSGLGGTLRQTQGAPKWPESEAHLSLQKRAETRDYCIRPKPINQWCC